MADIPLLKSPSPATKITVDTSGLAVVNGATVQEAVAQIDAYMADAMVETPRRGEDESITGKWDFTSHPTVNGNPFGTGDSHVPSAAGQPPGQTLVTDGTDVLTYQSIVSLGLVIALS